MTATPTLFAKGADTRFAYSPADEVSLRFRGFKPASETLASDEIPAYADLREQAKALGIPAKGKARDLAAAIVTAQEEASAAAGAQITVDEAIADLEGVEPSALEQVTTDTEAGA